ncbi:MAG: glucosidase [Saprospiraceae bacterium]|nr:glucosidase [Saprospiraceae bacterium]
MKNNSLSKEEQRLNDYRQNGRPWLKWGPYLSERQWGTVREDYSEGGTAWDFFPHDHARSKSYRWGEDGLAGISDELQQLCFAVALWNGNDPILKERLFGLTGSEGNHGEDVKELYYYLDNTPTHAYMKHLYKYPQAAYPYSWLLAENRRRGRNEQEFELLDTGIFNDNKYFDVYTEYAKASEEDILIKISVYNRGKEAAPIKVLPTLWFRNLWSFGLIENKPFMSLQYANGVSDIVKASHPEIGDYYFYFEKPNAHLFTENETNTERLYNFPNDQPYKKDAFHKAVIERQMDWISAKTEGTKFAPLYERTIAGGGSVEFRLRLSKKMVGKDPLGADFETVFSQRKNEADEFYTTIFPAGTTYNKQPTTNNDQQNIQRQALAGMLWSKQYFNIDIPRWLNGDPGQPAPPESRKNGRNSQWHSLNNEDIISMPDKWEYPWYAAWDLAFHCVPLAMVDANFAKNQLILFLREWYMHPNGQIPAYEWAFGDVNPPVHAWSCLQVFKMDRDKTGTADFDFLKRVFQKLLLNFTWWVNRKDSQGKNVFEGGFLGLDNIGVFDRSAPLPGGGHLEQADGTAWMAMYCLNMLEMALLLCEEDQSYEDVATKFFEHFVYIAESLNRIGKDWTGAWDEEEGFFYDILALPGHRYHPLKVRSLVGLSTMFAVLRITDQTLDRVPDFRKRFNWFLNYRRQLADYQVAHNVGHNSDVLLSLTHPDRLRRLLHAMLDENEFLSKGGIRSVSKIHETPYVVNIEGQDFGLQYEPGESTTGLFGGNSNWRGPVWFPMNYLLINSLREYHTYFQDDFKVECPTGSGQWMNLGKVADDLSRRLISNFEKGEHGERPCHGGEERYATDPHFNDLVLFYEYFHGDKARGVGASHQTGWTGVVAELISSIGKQENKMGKMEQQKAGLETV